MDDTMCECGHKAEDHDLGIEWCEVWGCECPEFMENLDDV